MSEEKRDSHGRFIKGSKKGMAWGQGLISGWKQTKEAKIKIGLASKGNNYAWVGDKAAYSSKHDYQINKWGKATKCENENCTYKSPRRYEWANISGKYLRQRDDYIQLCPSCHRRWDRGFITINGMKGVPKLLKCANGWGN
jgi:hypothetical protein